MENHFQASQLLLYPPGNGKHVPPTGKPEIHHRLKSAFSGRGYVMLVARRVHPRIKLIIAREPCFLLEEMTFLGCFCVLGNKFSNIKPLYKPTKIGEEHLQQMESFPNGGQVSSTIFSKPWIWIWIPQVPPRNRRPWSSAPAPSLRWHPRRQAGPKRRKPVPRRRWARQALSGGGRLFMARWSVDDINTILYQAEDEYFICINICILYIWFIYSCNTRQYYLYSTVYIFIYSCKFVPWTPWLMCRY